MTIDPSIFKAYDIRGIYPAQINEETAAAIAREFAWLLMEELAAPVTIGLACDMRLSSPALKQAIIDALVADGVKVVDMGLLSTPTYYYGVAKFGYDGGIQISASHNPKEYNGLKMVRRGGKALSADTGLQTILHRLQTDTPAQRQSHHSASGVVEINDTVLKTLVDEVLSLVLVDHIKPLEVVADASNAMAALDLKALFERLPQCKLIPLHFDLDGSFPGHGEADPMKDENLHELCQKVSVEESDLGIATDGDGDRYFFVDNTGKAISQPIIRGLAAQMALKDNPGATVAYDIRPGKVTQDMIDEVGGKAIVTKVGHSLIKQNMIEVGAVFGGESSGHYFYKLPCGTFEVPLLLTAKLLEHISRTGKTIAEIIQPYDTYFNTGEINTKVNSKEEVQNKIALIKQRYGDGEINEMDGLFISYPDVWFIVRGSNTEPMLRLIVESADKQRMEQVRDEVLGVIRG